MTILIFLNIITFKFSIFKWMLIFVYKRKLAKTLYKSVLALLNYVRIHFRVVIQTLNWRNWHCKKRWKKLIVGVSDQEIFVSQLKSNCFVCLYVKIKFNVWVLGKQVQTAYRFFYTNIFLLLKSTVILNIQNWTLLGAHPHTECSDTHTHGHTWFNYPKFKYLDQI